MQLCSTAFTVCCQHSTDTTSQEGSFMQLCSTAFTVCCQHSTDTTSQEGSFMLPYRHCLHYVLTAYNRRQEGSFMLSCSIAFIVCRKHTYYRNQEIFPALFLLCAVRIDRAGAKKDYRYCLHCVLLVQIQQEPGKTAGIVFIVCCQDRQSWSQETLPVLSSLCAVEQKPGRIRECG